MKAKISVAVLLLFSFGCTSRQTEPLTQQQKDQIKHEVKTICDSIWAKWDRMDGNGVLQYLWDTPEFVAFNLDGSRSDIEAIKKGIVDLASSATAIKLFPSREDFYVLSKDAVVYAWFGKTEISMKTGDKITYDPEAETYVFNKVAGQWQIVYIQQSATVFTQKAGKK